jgi:hypothetical protein
MTLTEKLNTLSTRHLRHFVRSVFVTYSRKNPEDFQAHQDASAMVWLLAGRPGISIEQRGENTGRALVIASNAVVAHPNDSYLHAALAACGVLVDRVVEKAHTDLDAEAEQVGIDAEFEALVAGFSVPEHAPEQDDQV